MESAVFNLNERTNKKPLLDIITKSGFFISL